VKQELNPMRLRAVILLAIGWACVAVQPGCARSVILRYESWGQPAPQHRFDLPAPVMTTREHKTYLYVGGVIEPPGYAYDSYEFAIHQMEDDTGKQLAFKAFSMEYAKASFVSLVFEEPAEDAKMVKMDITFKTVKGEQRITQELPIKRNPPPGPGLKGYADWPTTQPRIPPEWLE
jgi:hypothetical protein